MSFSFEQQATCQVCGSEASAPYWSLKWKGFPDFAFVACRDCGFVYMNPVPDAESYVRFYRDYFWDCRGGRLLDRKEMDDAERDRQRQASIDLTNLARLEKVERYLKASQVLDGDTRVLEIGCAFGGTLAHLHREFGVEVFAVEPSEDAVQYMAEKHPFVKVIGRSLEELFDVDDDEWNFDVIITSHSLENVRDQNAALSTIRRLLGPRGIYYVDTPNVVWHRRAFNPYHPVLYSPEAFTTMVKKHGFSIARLDHCPAPSSRLLPTLLTYAKSFTPYLTAILRADPEGPRDARPHTVDVDEMLRRQRQGYRVVRWAANAGRAGDMVLGRTGKLLRY